MILRWEKTWHMGEKDQLINNLTDLQAFNSKKLLFVIISLKYFHPMIHKHMYNISLFEKYYYSIFRWWNLILFHLNLSVIWVALF